MKILITGANGQLGRQFIKTLKFHEYEYLAMKKDQLDITNFNNVSKVFHTFKPDVVINCAAYNEVDKAEIEFEQALKVNCIGVSNLAVLCREIKALLVHYSTDYVFDGEKKGLYLEEDQPNPQSKYALSKYLGERQIGQILENYIIFRTSWVYGEGINNFLYKLNQWILSADFLKIACDEFSVPTSTKTIVEVTIKALEYGLRGLYNLVNNDYASRYEWAKEYLRLRGIKKFIYPAYQIDFNLPAKRPRFSAMSNEKISRALNIEITDWKEELKKFIDNSR